MPFVIRKWLESNAKSGFCFWTGNTISVKCDIRLFSEHTKTTHLYLVAYKFVILIQSHKFQQKLLTIRYFRNLLDKVIRFEIKKFYSL